MANISNYLEEAVLNHVFRDIDFPRPGATIYVAIFEDTKDTDELEADNFDGEIKSYDGTDRPSTGFAAPTQEADGAGSTKAVIASEDDVIYTGMEALTVKYIALVDQEAHAAVAPHILYWIKLTTPRVCAAGDECKFPAGNIKVDLN